MAASGSAGLLATAAAVLTVAMLVLCGKAANGEEDISQHLDKWRRLQNITGFYYYFGSESLNWIESFRFCAERGGKLLSIETDEENTAIFRYIERKLHSQHQWWTSGSNMYTRGADWTWMATGKNLSYSAWCRGEPNNRHRFDFCLQLRLPVQCWNDVRCGLRRGHAICEKPEQTSLGPLSIVHGSPVIEAGSHVWSPCMWFVRYVKKDPQWQVRCMSPVDF